MKEVHSNPNIEKMFQAGAHFGYSKTRRHPSVAKYVFTTKNKVDIIDIEKSARLLDEAKQFVKDLSSKGKQILFVGVKPESRAVVARVAEELGMPYVMDRWIGGTLTNFPEIKRRIALLEDLRSKKEKGELEKYTKKERLLIDRDIISLDKMFGGLVTLKKAEALFIIDAKREHIAVLEAKKMNIAVIALASTDTDIRTVNYPIVANDASLSSISYFVEEIAAAYKDGILTAQQ